MYSNETLKQNEEEFHIYNKSEWFIVEKASSDNNVFI